MSNVLIKGVALASEEGIRPLGAAEEERPALTALQRLLSDPKAPPPNLVSSSGEAVALPPAARRLFYHLARLLAEGHLVALVPVDKELTTQQAADLLNVSRPHLIHLLEQQAIAFTKTGTHRRIRFDDVMAYKQRRDTERKERLRELTQLTEDLGLYDLPALDEPVSR